MLLITILALFLGASFISCIHGQSSPATTPTRLCFASVEGQGLYVVGGDSLNLTVSWNTSAPVHSVSIPIYGDQTSCAVFNDGKDLFAMKGDVGCTFNLESGPWIEASNSNFMSIRSTTATTDPESGIIYVPNNVEDLSGKRVIFSFDMKTKNYNTTAMSSLINAQDMAVPIAWSPSLRGIVFLQSSNRHVHVHIFTPNKVSESSSGWDMWNTTGEADWGDIPSCFVSAYGGSKMALFSHHNAKSAVYLLDLATLKWTKGSSIPALTSAACAVSEDQFILWSDSIRSPSVFVYNMKTDAWVTDYIAPSPRTPTSTPTHDTVPNPSDASFTGEKPHVIVAIAVGVLLAISATIIFAYLRVTKQMRAADDNGIAPHSSERQRWYRSELFNCLFQSSAGRRRLPKHPQAVMDDQAGKRNVQEGAVEIEQLLQDPHTVTENEITVEYKVEVKIDEHHT